MPMVLPTPKEPSGYVQSIAGDRSGLEVSLYRLIEDKLVQGEIRHRSSQLGQVVTGGNPASLLSASATLTLLGGIRVLP
jgi:hypothetical protein